MLLESSVKKGLDVDWNDATEKAEAIKVLTAQLTSLLSWLERRLPEELAKPPLSEDVATLKQGVAEDRRVSIEDPARRAGNPTEADLFHPHLHRAVAAIRTRRTRAAARPVIAPRTRGTTGQIFGLAIHRAARTRPAVAAFTTPAAVPTVSTASACTTRAVRDGANELLLCRACGAAPQRDIHEAAIVSSTARPTITTAPAFSALPTGLCRRRRTDRGAAVVAP